MLRKNQHALKKMRATIFPHLFNELSFYKTVLKFLVFAMALSIQTNASSWLMLF